MLTFRDATLADLPAVIAMYADDALGADRELVGEPVAESYLKAFAEIDGDPRHRLVVVEESNEIVGTIQLSFIPHLVLQGGERAQIEAVRVRAGHRRAGVGTEIFRWAVAQAEARGCCLVQLTTNLARPDAKRFYERLGFTPSHVGMKLALTKPSESDPQL